MQNLRSHVGIDFAANVLPKSDEFPANGDESNLLLCGNLVTPFCASCFLMLLVKNSKLSVV